MECRHWFCYFVTQCGPVLIPILGDILSQQIPQPTKRGAFELNDGSFDSGIGEEPPHPQRPKKERYGHRQETFRLRACLELSARFANDRAPCFVAALQQPR
jgi:hypothetical protein